MARPARMAAALIAAILMQVAGPACAAAEDQSGGKGKLQASGLKGTLACFSTNSATVPQVCGHFTVYWKLWTLVGEPIGDYTLNWQVASVYLKQPGSNKGAKLEVTDLPKPLAAAAQNVELYLSGMAAVNPRLGKHHAWQPGLWLGFDTGVGVKPGTATSFNMPGGYDWNKFIQIKQGAKRCEDVGSDYLAPERARHVMQDGLDLTGLMICKSSQASVDGLEAALARLCEAATANASHAYCPPKDAPPKPAAGQPALSDVLDQAADAPKTKAKLAQLQAEFQREAQRSCQNQMASVRACVVKTGCEKEVDKLKGQCASMPRRPQSFDECMAYDPSVLTLTRECRDCRKPTEAELEEAARARRQARRDSCAKYDNDSPKAWDRQWADINQRCANLKNSSEQADQCLAAKAGQCNPKGISLDSCVAARLASGDAPTEATAHKAVQVERATRALPGSSAPRPNFLE